jgi:GDP-L-fucose synthase
MDKHSRIYVAGASGMSGSAIVRTLRGKGYESIIASYHRRRPQPDTPQTLARYVQLDMTDQRATRSFLESERPECVFLAAAKVGGIHANDTYPADFIYENLIIETNAIHGAHCAGVQHLLFLGSSCIYPRLADQPMRENALLTGELEPTNEPYAVAKIAGIKMCESYNRQYGRDYRSVMPTNLYGPNDNFHPENSHVIPALLRRFHEAVRTGAEEVVIWGSGEPKREFLHVDDMAAACLFVMELEDSIYFKHTDPMNSHVNVGTGMDCSIRELAETIAAVTGFSGRLVFDTTKPDGAPRKLLDVSRLKAMGWESRISLEEGLKQAYEWFLENSPHAKQTRVVTQVSC